VAATAISGEERIGLGVAIAAHIGLVALLVWRPPSPPLIPPPERMTVTISDNVGLTSTSPEPMSDAAPDMAPTIGEAPQAEPVAEPAPEPLPVPQPRDLAPPPPRPIPRPAAKPVAKETPTPPKTKPAPPKAKPSAAAPQQPSRSQRPTKVPAGGSSFADAFKEGVPGARGTSSSRTPAAQNVGPAVQSSLKSAVSRELKPHWISPQGADAEKLVTYLAWSLNRDGSLAGTPRVVRQEGITDANRPQAARHAEQAVRAVQLAAPFDLPEEYYDAWKRVGPFKFDRRLSQ
jgi:outer membrane biosynthesis protein TonB